MAETVTANGRDVATKGTGHVACTDDAPEELLIQGKPQPFFNYAYTKEALVSSATKTFYKEFPIWTETGKLDPSKEEPASPSGPGQTSGTYEARIQPAEWSPDVLVEGHGVVRWHDATHQNNANQGGHVVTEVEFQTALKKFLDARAAAALEALKKAPGAGKGPGDGRKADKGHQDKAFKKVGDETSMSADEHCTLKEVEVRCQHEEHEMGAERVLEVVPKNFADTITCKAEVEEACDKHVEWHVGGYYQTTKKGETITFNAVSWGNELVAGAAGAALAGGGFVGGIAAVLAMISAPSHDYSITATACDGEEKFIVKAFPGAEAGVSFEAEKEKWLEPPRKLIEKICEALKLSVKVDPPAATGGIKCGWGEHEKDWRAYCQITIEGGFDPLLGVSKEFEVPLPGPLYAVNAFLEFFDIGSLALLLTLSGKIFVSGAAFVRLRVNEVGGEVTLGGKLGLDFGPKLTVGSKSDALASAFGRIGGGAGIKGKLEFSSRPELFGELSVFVEALVGEVGVQFGSHTKKASVTIFGGGEWPIGHRLVFFPRGG
ncbi:MAG TPA: hypothetical protein VHB21_13755 [Minicystis sp.]|nr:hypothetical protein [Minicystis sp.]